jgi:hypothetical protein
MLTDGMELKFGGQPALKKNGLAVNFVEGLYSPRVGSHLSSISLVLNIKKEHELALRELGTRGASGPIYLEYILCDK